MGRKALPKIYVGLIGQSWGILNDCPLRWVPCYVEDHSYAGDRHVIDLSHRRKKASVTFMFAHSTTVHAAFLSWDPHSHVTKPLGYQPLSMDDEGIALCAGMSLKVNFNADELRALRRTL